MTPEIEEYARILVRQVRDRAVVNCDLLLEPRARSAPALKWKTFTAPRSELDIVVPDAIDEAVFNLLFAIDDGMLRLKFVASNGRELDLAEEGRGELAGWYAGSGGWRAMFSEQRFVDYLADMPR